MRVVILAGGKGTRLHGHEAPIPKPMTLVHKKPMLEHVMMIYDHAGYNEFVIAMGFRKEKVIEWAKGMAEYDRVFEDIGGGRETAKHKGRRKGAIICVDTGESTQTGGRIMKVEKHIEKTGMAAYGDGVGNIDIRSEVEFHKSHGHLATVATYDWKNRFGTVESGEGGKVLAFGQYESKPINIGFFIFDRKVLELSPDDSTSFEDGIAKPLAQGGQLFEYRHRGYWQCMDTPEELEMVRRLYVAGAAPWKFGESYAP